MRKTVLSFGSRAGLAMSAMLVLLLPFQKQIGPERGVLVGYATMVAAFLLVFFGVRAYRDDVADGEVGFGRALAVGALIVLVASVFYTVTWQIVFFGFMPDFLTDYQAHTLDQMRARGATAAELAGQRAEMARFAARYRNPAFNAAVTLLEPLPVGLVVAFVSAGVLRRRGPARPGVKELARAV